MLKDLLSSRLLIISLSGLALIYLSQIVWGTLVFFSDTLLILFLAWLLSFILSPLVDFLIKSGVNRLTASLIIYILISSLISLAIFSFLPELIKQLLGLSQDLPYFASQAPKLVSNLDVFLNQRGLDVELSKSFESAVQNISTLGLDTADRLVGFVGSFFSTLFSLLLVLIISFYFVLDGDRLVNGLIKLLPPRFGDEAKFFVKTVNHSFSGFLRGQLTVALIWGVVVWLVLTAFGIRFALINGLLAGMLMIIPIIGGFFALVPPLFTTLLVNPEVFLVVLIILLVVQVIEINILAPLIFERAVGLHPILVLVSFMVGLKLGGVWGGLFGVPVASIIWAAAKEIYYHKETSP